MGEALSKRAFPIMGDATIKSVPWWLVQTCEGQLRRNHQQTVERLAERGGLDLIELAGALTGRSWARLREINDAQAKAIIERRLRVQETGYMTND